MKHWPSLCVLVTGLIATAAAGQTPSPCPGPTEVGAQQLYGLWRAEFEGLPRGATLLFERHPEFSESVRGGISRDGLRHWLAGDVDEGEFTLEESPDGKHIAAVWQGTVAAQSCGKEIRGSWNSTSDPRAYPFVLRKLPESR